VVAKKYSIDAATKGNGGLLSGVTKGEEEQTLDTATFSAPVGKLLGPIHGQFGYYVLEVTKVTPATHQTLAQATALIRQILSGQQRTSAQTAVDNLAKKNWLPKTNCQSLYAMADCNGYKAPHTTTATTATPTTTSAPSTTTPSTTTTKTKSSG
jgi:foldase protein PrsA